MARIVSVDNEKKVTPAQIIKEADCICERVQELLKEKTPSAEIMKIIREQHPDFMQAYPIPVLIMAEGNGYSSEVMAKYLNWLAVNPWTSEEKYIAAQVKYMTMLYKFQHPHTPAKQIRALRRSATRAITEERERFKESLDEAKARVEKRDAALREHARAKLEKYAASPICIGRIDKSVVVCDGANEECDEADGDDGGGRSNRSGEECDNGYEADVEHEGAIAFERWAPYILD